MHNLKKIELKNRCSFGQSAFHEHCTEVLRRTSRNHLVWWYKLTTAWHKNIGFVAKYCSYPF